MKRDDLLKTLERSEWDIIIIGGGATGLGAAVDAASRGYTTLLLEQDDFAKATSSRSTKLIHGGLRYLQQGNLHLVREALHERGLLAHNAPHLVHHQSFLIPLYKWWEAPFYGAGLKFYDLLAGKLGLEPSRHLTRAETLDAIPKLHPEGLRGGALYYDGQFDDARLAITLAKTAVSRGATVLNYMKVTSFIKRKGTITGVRATDVVSGTTFRLHGKVVINATAIFSDHLRTLDASTAPPQLALSRGVHLVLPKSFLKSTTAILVPHAGDGRVVFIVPWYHRVLIGTTDTPVRRPLLDPKVTREEIDALLHLAGRYLTTAPRPSDIVGQFAGLRPLVKKPKARSTAALSRDHVITISPSGLVTIVGGKWTTYRKMGEDVIDRAAVVGGLSQRPCETHQMKLSGWAEGLDPTSPLSTYGSERLEIQRMARQDPKLAQPLLSSLPYTWAHVQWAIDHEMALSLEDVLARRTRTLLLDARGALAIAPQVACFMARRLNRPKQWEDVQVKQLHSRGFV